MVNVYAFPPVAVVARYWTVEQPVSRSRSLITGSSYVSASQRKRTLAGFDIVGWPKYSAGYLEALWRYLDGGINLVRLSSCRIPYGRTVPDAQRGVKPLDWSMPPQDLSWQSRDTEFTWVTRMGFDFTIEETGTPTVIHSTGLPANAVIAIPGEFATVSVDGEQEAIMITNKVVSDANGAVRIHLQRTPLGDGEVSIGTRETGVFELASPWPTVMNRLNLPENYGLQFREVFADERGPFVELDPWS